MVKKIPAIIPARGGSKGLPKKNVLDLCGKPLIAWTIEAALGSEYISEVVVSTDDEEIAEISRKYGAKIPFMRPDYLATDFSIAIDTYLYTIKKLNELNKYKIEDFVVLQPTSPLRKSVHINEAIQLFYNKEADSVLSFYENPHPTNWLKLIDENGYLTNYEKNVELKNRQDYKKTYLPNGAIIILKNSLLNSTKNYYTNKSASYIMKLEDSVDIDSLFDFKICEILLSKKDLK